MGSAPHPTALPSVILTSQRPSPVAGRQTKTNLENAQPTHPPGEYSRVRSGLSDPESVMREACSTS